MKDKDLDKKFVFTQREYILLRLFEKTKRVGVNVRRDCFGFMFNYICPEVGKESVISPDRYSKEDLIHRGGRSYVRYDKIKRRHTFLYKNESNFKKVMDSLIKRGIIERKETINGRYNYYLTKEGKKLKKLLNRNPDYFQ